MPDLALTPEPEPPAPALSNADLLRTATREAHERAEASAFMTRLLDGGESLAAWTLLLGQLRAVYGALEDVSARLRATAAGQPWAPLIAEGLDRRDAIARDLLALGTGPADTAALPATAAYAERIRSCADDPVRYIAHHYTRYLGDLSGGRIIGRRLADHYGLPTEAAAFFDFPGIPMPVPFKRAYRAALDAWPLDEPARGRLVEEARASFSANEAIFAAVDAALQGRRAEGFAA